MCFSAEASFATGAGLLAAGTYCTAATRGRPSFLPLAVVPLLFGLQQIAEGFVWVGLANNDDTLMTAAALMFLAFALGLWPFWVPFSVLCLERRSGARQWLAAATLFGLVLGCALYVPLVLDPGSWLRVGVVHHSLRYNPDGLPAFAVAPHSWWDAAYGMAVLVPLLAVPDRRFTTLSLTVVVSAAASLLVFRQAFVSVWCFFAALLSAQLCWIFSRGTGPEAAPAHKIE